MKFNLILLFTLFTLNSHLSNAQEDTLYQVTYDMVKLTPKPGEKYGKTLHGRILSIDNSTGVLVFKDENGPTYTLGVTEYQYYERDLVKVDRKRMRAEKKRKKGTLPRKESGFEFGFGASIEYLDFYHDFNEDEYYHNAPYGFGGLPTSIKAMGGIYLNKQNYVGGTVDFAVINDTKSYFSIGGRYSYHYGKETGNTSFYIPIEAKYTYQRFDAEYQYITGYDSTFQQVTTEEWNADISYNATTLSVGHGFSFIQKNKRSIALEVSVFAQVIMSHSFRNTLPVPSEPNSTFNGGKGAKLSLLFNL